MEVETKGLYDHGCPTTQDTLTHTTSPRATDHPGAAHINTVRPECVTRSRKTVEQEKGTASTCIVYLPKLEESVYAFF